MEVPMKCAQEMPVEPAKCVKEIACQTDNISGEDIAALNSDNFKLQDSEASLRLQIAELNLKSFKISDLNEDVLRKNDDLVKFYTGLDNFHILITLFNFVGKKVVHDPAQNDIPRFHEFLIVMIKLRQNMLFKDLALCFNISESTVSRIFTKWINGMYKTCIKLIIWPDRDVRNNSMPSSFRKVYGNRVASIIDCFEIFTDQPSSLKACSETWSHLKNHNTVKFLISIAPQGFVNFVSEGYCGTVSNEQITSDSNYLEYLEPGDLVLADHGFPIAELLKPINANVEFSASSETGDLRIHIKNVIGLLRNKFSILASTLPLEFISTKPDDPIPLIDKIVVICCALINLNPPIVKE